MTIKLPRPEWFYQTEFTKKITNEYNGSLRAESDRGCLHTKTFSYSVHVNTDEDDPVLEISCYWTAPWSEKLCRSRDNSATFPCTTEGVAEAEAWLDVEYFAGV